MAISQVGLLARSPEGHAARGMPIKGHETSWITIQTHTFTNWVNEQLRHTGLSVSDLSSDFCDGTRLCALVEALQRRKLMGWARKPTNRHQQLENVSVALNAVAEDAVRLVNIGNVDIVNGNLKLILGLIWSLIVRYQIGRSKFPPKKLMLAWLRAVLPECQVNNFTSDWNSGVCLSALVEYCQPGSFQHWQSLSPHNSVQNCREAMEVARSRLGVPQILQPEYLASPHLDELSGMTYLSYFMKESSPGFRATLRWVNSRIPPHLAVSNFTSDWEDGRVLCALVSSLGVSAKCRGGDDAATWEHNLNNGMEAGRKLGVEPLLRARDMTGQQVEHLGVMAYAAAFQWVTPRPPAHTLVAISTPSHSTRIFQQTSVKVDILDDEADRKLISYEVTAPEGEKVFSRLALDSNSGKLIFTPTRIGIHQVRVMYDGERAKGSPMFIRAMPELTTIKHTGQGMQPCAVGSIVEVLVHSIGPGEASVSDIEVRAYSPTGRWLDCPVAMKEGGYSATFQPDEAGLWTIQVKHSGNQVHQQPYTCLVYDPNGIKLLGIEESEKIHRLRLDTSATCGVGEILFDVVRDRLSVPHTVQRPLDNIYEVTLHTHRPGKYRIYIYFNGTHVKGSPFPFRVGSREHNMKTERIYSSTSHDRTSTLDPRRPATSTVSHPAYISDTHRTDQRRAEHQRAEQRLVTDTDNASSRHTVDTHTHSSSHVYDTLSKTTTTTTLNETQETYYRRSVVPASNSPVYLPFSGNLNGYRSPLGLAESPLHDPPSPVESSFATLTNSPLGGYSSPLGGHSSPLGGHSSPLGGHTSPSQSPLGGHRSPLGTGSSPLSSQTTLVRVRSPSPNILFHSVQTASPSFRECKVFGEALKHLPVNRTSTLLLETDAPLSQITVTVTPPSKSPVPVKMSRSNSREVNVYFSTIELGEHLIDIKINEHRISGSPFRSQGYNADAIQVGPIADGIVGQPVEFEIDGKRAGSGRLEMVVNGGQVTSFVRNVGNQRFIASFVPFQPLTHTVHIRFNNQSVPGSPWLVGVMGAGSGGGNNNLQVQVLGESVRLVPVGVTCCFQVSAVGYSASDVTVSGVDPSKRPIDARVVSEGRGLLRLELLPTEVGSHVLDVSVAGERLTAGPLVAKAYDSSLIRVTDLPTASVSQPCHFRVDASEAGEGQLEISINEGEVPNHVTVVGGGRCLVSFTPEHNKPHLIDIKFNGETLSGCPFLCRVADTSKVSVSLSGLELIAVNQVARFQMNVEAGGGSAELAVSVRGPDSELPVSVSGSVSCGFVAEFTPRVVGAHTVCVLYNGRPVSGTPFTAKAYDASTVYVGPLPHGRVALPLQFTVDASEAGEGNLEITISARGVNVPTQVQPQGNARFIVSFVPVEPTDHTVTIHFNQEPVPGSPLTAVVTGDLPLVSGSGLSSAQVGSDSHFTVTNLTTSFNDVQVSVEGPSGNEVAVEMKDTTNQSGRFHFTPTVVGEHKISVNYRQVAVAGSPFTCKVYDVNAIKVKPVSHGTVGQPVTFVVETREAGPGNLEVTVNEGRVGTTAHTQGPHTYAISFTPRSPTVHTVNLKFNHHDVPGSPFSVQVNDVGRVILPGEDKVSVGKVASFLVDTGSLGPPQVQIMSAMRNVVASTISEQGKHYLVTFTPRHVGDHSIEVKLGGSNGHVEGSPFLVKAYDPTKVKVTDINPGPVGKPIYFSINASEAGAGNLEIIVAVNGRNVPNYVQSEGNAKFRVNFKPKEASEHSLSVRFNGEPVPGSPFSCQVFERGEITVWGAGVKSTQAGRPTCLQIGCLSEFTDVRVTSPTGHRLPVKLTTDDSNTTAIFTPVEVGRHVVSVEVDREAVKGSPFHCNVYNVNNIKVSGLSAAKVGKAVTFSVDATEAGEGTLELVISTQTTTVKAEVNAVSRGLYDVTFVPHLSVPHYVNITFNDHDVPGSPVRCEVSDGGEERATATARGEGLSSVLLGQTAIFQVNPHSPDPSHIDAFVTGPDGVRVECRVERLETGLYRGQYKPVLVGPHSLTITQNSRPITKHPFTVHVFDPTAVRILDVSQAIASSPATFKVDTKGAGSGALSVVIRAGGQEVKHTLRELDSPGLYQVIYHPQLSTLHKIHLKYNNVYPPGSPLEVEVEDGGGVCARGAGLYQAAVSRPSTFVIETCGQANDAFDVVVTGPNSTAVPVRCYQQKDSNLMAEFTPTSIGTYKVEVLQNMRSIRSSPFYCQVFDVSKVRVENDVGSTVSVNDDISFKLRRKDAGFAELEVTCRSPVGQDLPLVVQSVSQDTDLIEFTPSLPGKYAFHITYGGLNLPESPVVFEVEEGGWTRAWGVGLSRARVGLECKFEVTGAGRPVITVTGPGGVEIPCDTSPHHAAQDHHVVRWTPLDPGPHDITVLTDTGQHVPGSPFRALAVAIDNVRSVHTLPHRIVTTVGLPYKLLVDTCLSGPGELVGECSGPGGRQVACAVHSVGTNRYEVVFTPEAPGPHKVNLTYGGFPLEWSPVSLLAEVPSGGVRLVLTGKGLASATTDQQAEFTIDGSQAGPGMPEVSMAGMKAEIKVDLEKLSENVYRATYTPSLPGAYLLNVTWSDRQVKGCPLKVTVTATSDAGKVVCSGEGLGVGTVGKHIRSFIDTRAAGPGELSAHCVGPSKVAYCELYDHGDGTFSLNVKPQEAGRHTLTVKYAGVDVPGSPFVLRVAGAADASRVRVYGAGVQHGVLATFQSRFMCDTRGAGAGQLSVRVRGPKGAFRVEMQRASHKDRLIMCKYDPTEPGDYRVEVKWAGQLVPGSPFPVMIFDTQEELNKFLQGTGLPSNDIYGSVTYSTGYAHITA